MIEYALVVVAVATCTTAFASLQLLATTWIACVFMADRLIAWSEGR